MNLHSFSKRNIIKIFRVNLCLIIQIVKMYRVKIVILSFLIEAQVIYLLSVAHWADLGSMLTSQICVPTLCPHKYILYLCLKQLVDPQQNCSCRRYYKTRQVRVGFAYEGFRTIDKKLVRLVEIVPVLLSLAYTCNKHKMMNCETCRGTDSRWWVIGSRCYFSVTQPLKCEPIFYIMQVK